MDEHGRALDDRFGDRSRAARRKAAQLERAGRPRMQDLTQQQVLFRSAAAEAEVAVSHETISAIVDGTNARGDVLTVAELAGVIAAKKTSDLIPLAHVVAMTDLRVRAVPDRAAGVVRIHVDVAAQGQSGVEMEALTAAAIASLTVVDMVRDHDASAHVREIKLLAGSDGATEQDAFVRARPVGPGPKTPPGARMAGRFSSGRGSRGGARRPGS